MPSADMHTGEIISEIERLDLGEIRLMEVCGTHTMSIAKSGLRSMLPKNIKLLSGPGCPVCVTPPEVIDAVLELAMEKDVIITTYGDMLRVPGSTPGDSLQAPARAMGARVQMVYSPVDAVQLAKENPDKQVVFLGVALRLPRRGLPPAALTAAEQRVGEFLPLLRRCQRCGGAEGGEFLPLVDAQNCGARAARAHGHAGFQYRRLYLPGSRGYDNRR